MTSEFLKKKNHTINSKKEFAITHNHAIQCILLHYKHNSTYQEDNKPAVFCGFLCGHKNCTNSLVKYLKMHRTCMYMQINVPESQSEICILLHEKRQTSSCSLCLTVGMGGGILRSNKVWSQCTSDFSLFLKF